MFVHVKKAFFGLFEIAKNMLPENSPPTKKNIRYDSVITCPYCGHQEKEKMPEDVCVLTYVCLNCKKVLTHKPGDCCVFCSYGDTPCPSRQ